MSKRPRIHRRRFVFLTLAVLFFYTAGCCTVPYRGERPTNPKFHRGNPFPLLDIPANLLALPYKLILWNWHFGSHCVSQETEDVLETYLKDQKLEKVNVEINRFCPHSEFRRLFKNGDVALGYRIYPGILTTLISTLISRIWGSDYYNPFTNTIHILSDDPTIALHEAGHAADFAGQRWRGTYALMRSFPFVDLYQEDLATKEVIRYLKEKGDEKLELRAYKTLYPALSTYVANYQPNPILAVGAIFGGHVIGRYKAREREKDFKLRERIAAASRTSAQT